MFFLILPSEILLLVSCHQHGCSSLLWARESIPLIHQISANFCIAHSPGSPFTNDSLLNIDLCVMYCFTDMVSPLLFIKHQEPACEQVMQDKSNPSLFVFSRGHCHCTTPAPHTRHATVIHGQYFHPIWPVNHGYTNFPIPPSLQHRKIGHFSSKYKDKFWIWEKKVCQRV